ncbi:hypothetical protein HAX54_040889, partial [Datura stramonium]|nr:hypothetical protein [Datura stramonium]
DSLYESWSGVTGHRIGQSRAMVSISRGRHGVTSSSMIHRLLSWTIIGSLDELL